MIRPSTLRTLTLEAPSRPGRPAHVSAASALVRAGEHLYVVADDENHLGVFAARGTQPGVLVPLLAQPLPLAAGERKRAKRDFESLVRLPAFEDHPDGALLALGSCSKPNRCLGVLARLDRRGALDGTRREIDLEALRDALESRFGRLNIEGALVRGGELVLLQRGNKGDRRNALIRLGRDRAGATEDHLPRPRDRALGALARHATIGVEALIDIVEVDLGSVGEVPLGFSDGAALADGRIAFTAIAEDTGDSYADGPCQGAAIGVMSGDGRIDRLEPVEPACKVEGIEAWMEGPGIHALLVTDADDSSVPAALMGARIF